MTITISLEYSTRWGESLVLNFGKKEIPMRCTGLGRWGVTLKNVRAEALENYRFKVLRDGEVIRREWRHHSLPLSGAASSTSITIRERWQDAPEDAPFYSSAFTGGIFSRTAASAGDPVGASASAKTAASAQLVGAASKARGENGTTLLVVNVPVVGKDEVLCIAGTGEGMDNWRKMTPLDDSSFPQWKIAVDAEEDFEYKLVIADRATLAPIQWEEGENRVCTVSGDGFTVIADIAHRFGLRRWRGAGVAVPVFSLRTEDDFGVGEFRDIKKLVDWAAQTGQCVIQLLPVNDTTMTRTWTDSYPYNANSTFALHPQFICLEDAGVKADEAFKALQSELNALEQIDCERVNAEKIRLLRGAFARDFKKLSATESYKDFYSRNAFWLRPYAVFCALRDEFGTADFKFWKGYAKFSQKKVSGYEAAHPGEVQFYCFLQYHLDRQLSEVCAYAHSKGVVLKGDLPIGISRTSVDAWQFPRLFNMDESAGAPPDAFAADGQNWGFPTYNWSEMARDGYAWWKARMRKMSEYFDLFRIDHILGFFRIWEIPVGVKSGLLGHFNPALPYPAEELAFDGFDVASGAFVTPPSDDPTDVLFVEDPLMKGYWHPRIAAQNTPTYRALDPHRQAAFNRIHDDFFYRRHNDFWKENALRKLPALLHATQMLSCGEDLGMIPDCVASVMAELKILSLEIQRMPKTFGEEFADPKHYPYLCVCTTSTHDMNPLRAWWEEDREASARFFRLLGLTGEAPKECEPWLCEKIVKDHLDSPAMLTILPLQDYLSLDGSLRAPDPHSERINIPADSRHYWRYRLHIPLESLLKATPFNSRLKDLISHSGR